MPSETTVHHHSRHWSVFLKIKNSATIHICTFEGEANSYKSPRMRLTQSGDLVAQKFNFLGLGGLRRASELYGLYGLHELYGWGGEKLEGMKGNLTGPETKVDVKFCVTWSHDPRSVSKSRDKSSCFDFKDTT